MKTGWSFSSEMRSAVLPEARRELIIISFERMSSFFCSSPWMLAVPAAPILEGRSEISGCGPQSGATGVHRLRSPARRTLVAMNLHVVWIAVRRIVRSPVWAASVKCDWRTC